MDHTLQVFFFCTFQKCVMRYKAVDLSFSGLLKDVKIPKASSKLPLGVKLVHKLQSICQWYAEPSHFLNIKWITLIFVVNFLKQDVIYPFLSIFQLFSQFKGISQEITHELHKFVYPVVVNQIPLLFQIAQELFKEHDSILFGDFEQELWNSGAEIMLVDHFIKVPQTVEQRLYDVR